MNRGKYENCAETDAKINISNRRTLLRSEKRYKAGVSLSLLLTSETCLRWPAQLFKSVRRIKKSALKKILLFTSFCQLLVPECNMKCWKCISTDSHHPWKATLVGVSLSCDIASLTTEYCFQGSYAFRQCFQPPSKQGAKQNRRRIVPDTRETIGSRDGESDTGLI
jgi:hypothetical protein